MGEVGSGLKSATEAALAAAGQKEGPIAGESARAVQLPLMPAETIADLTATGLDRDRIIREHRGKGRPPGAQNKSTKAWRDYLLSRYQSPLIMLAETYSRPSEDLAAELGCSKFDAFRVQQAAAAELAPYVHGKMPVEIDIKGDLPMMVMMDPRLWLAQHGGTASADGLPDLSQTEIIENQPLGEGDAGPVGQSELDRNAESHGNSGVQAAGQLIADQPAADHPARLEGLADGSAEAGQPPQAAADVGRPELGIRPEIFSGLISAALSGETPTLVAAADPGGGDQGEGAPESAAEDQGQGSAPSDSSEGDQQ